MTLSARMLGDKSFNRQTNSKFNSLFPKALEDHFGLRFDYSEITMLDYSRIITIVNITFKYFFSPDLVLGKQ